MAIDGKQLQFCKIWERKKKEERGEEKEKGKSKGKQSMDDSFASR